MLSYIRKLMSRGGEEGSFGDERLSTGRKGEALAAKLLKSKGFLILDKNFSCKMGELDIVARKGKLLVFCEVKTRASDRYGAPELAVTMSKQKKIAMLAKYYMKVKKLEHMQCRFDVVSITMKQGGGADIKHIESAFLPG